MDAKLQRFLQPFQHLKIRLEEIKTATNNFNDNLIGVGGFGNVYKGEVSHFKGRSMVAIKRLEPKRGQGVPEFLKEITMLSDYSHENLISLLGFCCEGGEMILVYEHASRGSLDRYINSPNLTWSRRLMICLDVAKALCYLHDPRETHRRLIHCDIKSANILLDGQWNAKVSDFGLSIMGSANEEHSVIVTLAAGTHGYCDPEYAMTHTLTKESDVYSFGVVLFEILCGRLCCKYSKGRIQQNLLHNWVESYKQKQLKDIIFKDPTIQQMHQNALETFSHIAYRCLEESREDRPKMAEVVAELEKALDSQELVECQEYREWMTRLFYYKEILLRTAEPSLKYSSNHKLWKRLCEGVLLNGGNTWFSLYKGQHCEMISLANNCTDDYGGLPAIERTWTNNGINVNSRFLQGPYYSRDGKFKVCVNAQFLSEGITYTVNLVFICYHKIMARKAHHIFLKYKLQGETEYSISYFADKRKDGWLMCELYQLTSEHRNVDLEIEFGGYEFPYIDAIDIEGIEFRPLVASHSNIINNVEHKDVELNMQPITDSDANWEAKLPIDYEEITKWSTNSMQWTTKKEAFSIFCKGFLINDEKEGSIWFSLDKNGKKCHMLSSTVIRDLNEDTLSLPESRFGKACRYDYEFFDINRKIRSQLLSSETTYASYLVYKLPENQSRIFEAPIEVKHIEWGGIWYIYLATPQTPLIRLKAYENTHNPLHRLKIKGLPRQRNDGWMEVQIWEFQTTTTTEMIPMHLRLISCCDEEFSGLIIEGVDFRPI